MSFDLNILVVQQNKPCHVSSCIEIENEQQMRLRYSDIWTFMGQTKGVWYSLGITEEGIFNALPLIRTNFDQEHIIQPFWIRDYDVLSNLTPLLIKEKYQGELIKVMKSMIDMSPIKTIMFMARYQGEDEEIIYGSIPSSIFFQYLNQSKISFNVCYIITK